MNNVIDQTVFAALETRMGDKFPVLLQGYVRDAQTYLDTIMEQLPAGQLDDIIHAAHSFKSSSGLLGITHVEATAETLEYTAKEMQENDAVDITILQRHAKALQQAFWEAKPELEKHLTL